MKIDSLRRLLVAVFLSYMAGALPALVAFSILVGPTHEFVSIAGQLGGIVGLLVLIQRFK